MQPAAPAVIPDVRVEFKTTAGVIVLNVPPEFLRPGVVVESMTLTVNSLAVVQVPFAMHGAAMLHTVCGRGYPDRDDDDVIAVEL